MSIVTSFLYAYCKENLKTRFFLQINKTDFKGMFIFIEVAIATAYIKYQKTEVCDVNSIAAAFC